MLIRPRAALGVWAALLAAAPAWGLDLHVDVGLDGVLVTGSWAPITVRCRLEPDEAPLRGQVVLDLPRQRVVACAVDMQLQPGQEAVARLAVPVGLAASDYQVRFVDTGGRVVASAVPAETYSVLDEDRRLVLLLGRSSLQAFRGQRDLLPRVVHLPLSELPREPRVLAGVDAIFLKGDQSAELQELARDPEWVETLRRYVVGGGRLVVLSDRAEGESPFWLNQPLAALLPVLRVRGTQQLPPPSLGVELGVPPDGPVWALDLVPAPGADERAPGHLGAPLGLGRVTVVTFDVDHANLRAVGATAGFLAGLVRRQAPGIPRLRADDLEQVSQRAFAANDVLGSLGFGLLIAAVLIQVLALGPLASYAARRRGPWAGLLLPPLVSVALGAVIMLGAALSRGPAQAWSLVYTFHDPLIEQSWAQVDLGLLAGRSERFSLEVGDLRPPAQSRQDLDVFRFRRPGPALSFAGGQAQELGPINLAARGFTHLELSGLVEPGAAAALRPPPLSLELGTRVGGWRPLRVRCGGTAPLKQVLLLAIGLNDTRYAVVELEPGVTLSWDPASGGVLGDTPPPQVSVYRDPVARVHLLEGLAHRLEWQRHRAAAAASPLDRVSFPNYWVVALRPLGELPLTLRGSAGQPVTSQLQAAFFSAGDEP